MSSDLVVEYFTMAKMTRMHRSDKRTELVWCRWDGGGEDKEGAATVDTHLCRDRRIAHEGNFHFA